MLTVIGCENCGKQMNLAVNFKFTYKQDHCPTCHNINNGAYDFMFCDLKCFFYWAKNKKVATKGVPCQQCRGSGWAHGFKDNGICDICDGTKSVKQTKDAKGNFVKSEMIPKPTLEAADAQITPNAKGHQVCIEIS